jgi:hypothetical protein
MGVWFFWTIQFLAQIVFRNTNSCGAEDLIAAFRSKEPAGTAVAELEVLLRAAIFKPVNELVGVLLQQDADRIDAAYIPKPGEQAKGREALSAGNDGRLLRNRVARQRSRLDPRG